MTIEQVVRQRLLSLSALTALVSTRIYLLVLPQKPTLPAVRVALVSEDEPMHLRGVNNLNRTRIQVDAFAPESSGSDPYSVASNIADAIQGDWSTGSPPNGLSGWLGTDGGSPPTIRVLSVQRIDRDTSFQAEEFRHVRVRQDYWVFWKRLS